MSNPEIGVHLANIWTPHYVGLLDDAVWSRCSGSCRGTGSVALSKCQKKEQASRVGGTSKGPGDHGRVSRKLSWPVTCSEGLQW